MAANVYTYFFPHCNNMFVFFMSKCSFNITPKLQSNIQHGCCGVATRFITIFASDVSEMLIVSHFTLFNHRKINLCAYTGVLISPWPELIILT